MKKVDAGATKGLVKPKKTPKAREAEGRPENSLLRLQQGLGNRALGALLDGGLQRQPEEEEEPLQGQEEVQTKSPEGEEEEEAGEEEEFEEEALLGKEEEEPLQGKADLQRQEEEPEEEEEEPLQGKPDLQAQEEEGEEEEEEEEEEESVQPKADLQAQGPEEEEEPLQGQEEVQTKSPEGEEEEEAGEEEEFEEEALLGKEEEEGVQGKTDKAEVMGAIDAQRGGGQGLPPEVREQAEAGLGFELRGVRVHTDTEADRLARGLSAKAFTTGKDIFFRSKDYDPHSAAGQELIGHELTHVVQQRQGLSEPAGRPGDRYEQEADRVAAAFARQPATMAGVQGKAEGLQAELQRQSEPEEEEEVQPQEEEEEEPPTQAQKGSEEQKPGVAAGLKALVKGIKSEAPKPKIGTSKVKIKGKKWPFVKEY